MLPHLLNAFTSVSSVNVTPANQALSNAITGQNLAIVSEAKGTTTDPVYKAMETAAAGTSNDH